MNAIYVDIVSKLKNNVAEAFYEYAHEIKDEITVGNIPRALAH